MTTELARKKRRLDKVRSIFDEFLGKHELPTNAKADFFKLKCNIELMVNNEEGLEKINGKRQDVQASWGEHICTIEKLKFLSPRGKLRILFYEEAVLLQAANKGVDAEKFSIPHDHIEEMIILKDQKDTYICISLSEPMRYGKRKVEIVLIAIDPEQISTILLKKQTGELKNPVSGKTVSVMKQLLEASTEEIFSEADENIFQAHDGSVHIQCCVGARQGSLYPLLCGILFITTPLKFFPRKSILEIAADLGVGTRTFDVGIYHDGSDKPFIFSMVPRQEQDALTNYRRFMKIGAKIVEETNESQEDEAESGDGGSDSEFDIGEEIEISKHSMARDHLDLKKDKGVDYSLAMDKTILKLGAQVKAQVPCVKENSDVEENLSTDDETE